jgi:hypothetical protein
MAERSGTETHGRSGPVAVGTIIAKNYLAFARVLADSWRRYQPDVPLFVLLADEAEGYFEPAGEAFPIIGLGELDIPDRRSYLFRYTRQQVVVSAKPYLLRYLLDRGFASAVFLDTDILVLNRLTPLMEKLSRHPIVLTPHLLAPTTGDDRVARELNILVSGVYNGGCLGVAESPTARAFLAWWAERLYDHCRLAVAEGMHYDQRWLEFVPVFFEDVCILRDPGMNVAYWNLRERDVRLRGDEATVNGEPVRFFHFSGFEPERPELVSRYSPALTTASLGDPAALFERYASLLDRAGEAESRTWPYAYDRFDNGVPIPDLARRLYTRLGQAARGFGDPFAAKGSGSFFAWLNAPVDGQRDPAVKVSRLWQAVYAERSDLREVFPDMLGRDRAGFLDWTRRYGRQEYHVAEALVAGVG